MRKKTHRQVQKRLSRIRDRLMDEMEGQLRTCREAAGEKSSESIDFANSSYSEDMAAALAEMEHREIREVEEALERIKSGEYGKCRSCGKRISKARLEALPFATLCLKCKRAEEEEGDNVATGPRYVSKDGFGSSPDDADGASGRLNNLLRDIERDEFLPE